MEKHCKGCKYHHNAGHKKEGQYSKKHNDWCRKFSGHASKLIGHCKINNGKEKRHD